MRRLFTFDRLSVIVRLRSHVQDITPSITQVRVDYPVVIDVLDGLVVHFVVIVVVVSALVLLFFFFDGVQV